MTSLSDILFPSQEANTGINHILSDLKRSNLSITTRLRSIQQDADFVEEVAATFGNKRPLVANERCGSWYIRPGRKGASAYFKSTDGHTGQWKFSTRRLNLHLLPIIEKCDGIIIVDSTRRGKRRPDALSKTIPIWCCVLNRALFPSHPESHDLHVPPSAVSASEKSQMLARIPEGLDAFLQLKPDLATLRAQLSKPLRPTWITQETTMTTATAADDDDDDRGEIFEKFRPVVCCTSSRRVVDGEMSGHAGYVQGAGDDTENWAHGLTPPVFWAHADALLGTPEGDLPDLIRSLVAAFPPENFDVGSTSSSSSSSSAAADALPPSVRRLTPHLYVSPLPLPLSLPGGDATWCTIALVSTPSPPGTWARSPRHMEVGLGRHKAASRNLRTALVTICSFATRFLTDDSASSSSPGTDVDPQQALNQQPRKRILVACETSGKDLAVGVALALLCWCFEDEEGAVVRRIGGEGAKYAAAGESEAAAAPGPETNSLPSFNKTMIRIRLGRIMMAMPDANPNRATLQSVNSFLMDWVK